MKITQAELLDLLKFACIQERKLVIDYIRGVSSELRDNDFLSNKPVNARHTSIEISAAMMALADILEDKPYSEIRIKDKTEIQ